MEIYNSKNSERKLRTTGYLMLLGAVVAAALMVAFQSYGSIAPPHFRIGSLLCGLSVTIGGLFVAATEDDDRIRFIGWTSSLVGLLLVALSVFYF